MAHVTFCFYLKDKTISFGEVKEKGENGEEVIYSKYSVMDSVHTSPDFPECHTGSPWMYSRYHASSTLYIPYEAFPSDSRDKFHFKTPSDVCLFHLITSSYS